MTWAETTNYTRQTPNFTFMERRIIATDDGSHTIEIPSLSVTYHSRRGALEESRHVFINAGLQFVEEKFPQQPLSVFEMGFGTGLNALLTAVEAEEKGLLIQYATIDAYPVAWAEAASLHYGDSLHQKDLFRKIHAAPWDMETNISDHFLLRKDLLKLEDWQDPTLFHVIYYDAFAPAAQPDLWTAERFRALYERLHPGGVLTTYCSKTVVRRAMEEAGFVVTKPPGPWGKREMVRAVK
jgi:tRNA U34 5-methylaminomethyl-2-thiouridine-forming methyltransferase MnmC